ncbi:ABC transporter substrate-binding protein [Methylobacterium brachythecii]|uniref:ABC transporter substrate binding protein (PQQ-dependent alcohol dehydrogenase system) n=1 Tax=Methylobacterium brachythecii TaxID=1176177 RepID=A0A7W6F6I9_9HYPH|nr:ABC transporter substrate-binding protein [Methylobacterium brachythecii]MBB3902467.1 ABC transporter substrate binding protein (PQQ-dependent alcohol dehydrogenase system) [Methylobacterium brachythecii]GLS42315.1 branched-chain amino acid ABC transporter substrate-binding protein [Methylobacterium brachythecii]
MRLCAAGLRCALVIPGITSLLAGPADAQAAKPAAASVAIHYIERRIERPTPLNNEDPIPDDEGLKGAELGIKDSNATGRFVGLSFTLKPTIVEAGADIRAAFADIAKGGPPRFAVVNAPADDVLALADSEEGRETVFLNVGATDMRLRDGDCRARLLHVIPSRDMLADALMQLLVFKRWTRLLLVSGPNPADGLYAEALRRSAKKFGAKIVAETSFDARGADLRDSALREFALVTRGPEHDVVAVADEAGEFGTNLVYNTASPRPVVGTQGLTPAAWGRAVEAWAAAQLQQRFRKLAGRTMLPVDWAGWMAVHAVGEAAVQLKSGDPAAIKDLMLSPKFEVGGFKGRSLSFRPWNGQLRQPLYLLWPGAVVAAAPIEGFLHRRTELDTLGLDQPESACKAMGG